MPKTWKEAHDIWEFPKVPHKRMYRLYTPETGEHPARTYPFIVERIIETYSEEGDFILDPMCGVGVTIVEGIKLWRSPFGIEPEDRYRMIAEQNLVNVLNQTRLGDFFLREKEPRIFSQIYDGYAEEHLPIMRDIKQHFQLITFSPPYEGIDYTCRSASGKYKREPDHNKGFDTSVIPASQRQVKRYYSSDPKNIANKKGEEYWISMELIYNLCYDVGDVMAVIVKNQIKNHKERDFAQETIDQILKNTNWKFLRAHLAMLPQAPHWENVRRKKYPHADQVDWEHVLVFEK